MKRLMPLILATSLALSGCVASTPGKARTSSSSEAQRERARQAFDELEGRPPAQAAAPASKPAPEPPHREEYRPAPAKGTPAPDFSESTHLIAKGYGQSRPEAVRRAKAELSNIFESRIESDISSVTRAVTDSAQGDTLYKNVQSKIRVASSVELEGVEIGSVTKDGREYMAEAGLDRARAAEKWQHDINRLNARIEVEEQAARASRGKLMQLKHLNEAMDLFIEREALVSRLRVINRPTRGADHKEFEALVSTLQKVKTDFRLNLKVDAPNGEELSRKLAKKLTEAGFLVESNGRGGDATLHISMTLSRVELNNPNFKFMRATADVAIIDPTTGKMVGSFNENKREGHITYQEAGVKATRSLAGALSAEIVAYFN
ncbi:hypothetical protein [Desulfoluna spongiiphila]|uniref:LPP20 lipoprotein n=1 Tax=Desulfoluna spongiiphila TaxID=419481 RepID=A0A1G5E7J6_9BACT|nr:hypothetical protein [Desulfoluna spongiiphila]SCY22660.1 hypothetical protein SAMN05216233_105205 [Desulfoluna spongiiphila]